MVVNQLLEPSESISIIKEYFNNNFRNFVNKKEGSYTGYWWIGYKNENNDISIYFDGDIGGHFYVKIYIDNDEYNLWQFDKSVNHATINNKTNLLYQLNVLKRFLLETEK
ncbi:MAG: hypothetical protein GF364_07960 [Candidatus Lokiarchaeota archaeon]|nr:hypothetical protein [Candidatus Lokiarchaeota archaeon]